MKVPAGAAALLLLLVLAGCGYQTGGKAATVPPDVRTVAIPVFENRTQSYRLEQILTAAVVREFTTRTKYQIVHSKSDTADATLAGIVTQAQLAPLTYDSQTGRLTSGLVTVNMRVTFTDHTGKVLYENQNYVFRQQYEISTDPASFFQEESPAISRLAEDFARTLVSNILENY